MADHHLVAIGLEQPRISRGMLPQWCRIKFRCRGITIRERIYQSKNIPCADMPEHLVYTPGIRRQRSVSAMAIVGTRATPVPRIRLPLRDRSSQLSQKGPTPVPEWLRLQTTGDWELTS